MVQNVSTRLAYRVLLYCTLKLGSYFVEKVLEVTCSRVCISFCPDLSPKILLDRQKLPDHSLYRVFQLKRFIQTRICR